MSNGWNFNSYLQLALGLMCLGGIIFLSTLAQVNKPVNTFSCPLMPVIPCIGILGNFILVSKIPLRSWVFFLIFEGVGLLFYFGYGMKHSKLNKLFKQIDRE